MQDLAGGFLQRGKDVKATLEIASNRTKELQDWITSCGSKEVIKERLRELSPKLRKELYEEAMCDDRVCAEFETCIGYCPIKIQEMLVLEAYCKYDDILGWVAMPKKGWNEGNLPSANIVHSSSLFHVQSKKLPRRTYKNEVMVSRASTFIEYTGEELYQDDLDVLLCLVKLSGNAFGVWQTVSPAIILKMLGKTDCGQSYENLEAILRRLRAGLIFVDHKPQDSESRNSIRIGVSKADAENTGKRKPKGGFVSLNIVKELIYARGCSIRYVLDPRLVRLFGNNEYGLVDIKKRIALGQGDLAKMLQCLFSGSGNLQYHNVAKLYAYSGMRGERKKFTQSLIKALNRLKRLGIIFDFSIKKAEWGASDKQVVCVQRTETKDPMQKCLPFFSEK